jgi:hypothetical protein
MNDRYRKQVNDLEKNWASNVGDTVVDIKITCPRFASSVYVIVRRGNLHSIIEFRSIS